MPGRLAGIAVESKITSAARRHSPLVRFFREDSNHDAAPEPPRLPRPGRRRDRRRWPPPPRPRSPAAARSPGRACPRAPTDKVTLGKTGIQVSLVGMGTGSVGSGQASNQTRLGVKEFTRVVRHALDRGVCLLRRRRPVRLAHLPARGPQGRPPRQVRDPDQDPRHQRRRRPQPPRALPHGAGRRLHRHRPAPLHDRRPTGPPRTAASMDYLMQAKERGAHPRPRHELPRHGPAPHRRQEPVRRGRPRPDQPRGADHGRQEARRGRLASSRRCTTPARASSA